MRSSSPSKTTILLVRVRPVRRAGFVLLGPSHKNFDFASDQPLVRALRGRIDDREQVLIALLFHLLVDLLSHRRRRRFAAAANSER